MIIYRSGASVSQQDASSSTTSIDPHTGAFVFSNRKHIYSVEQYVVVKVNSSSMHAAHNAPLNKLLSHSLAAAIPFLVFLESSMEDKEETLRSQCDSMIVPEKLLNLYLSIAGGTFERNLERPAPMPWIAGTVAWSSVLPLALVFILAAFSYM
jgi:hypothetical protein